MEVQVVVKPLEEANSELLVLTVFEDELENLDYLKGVEEKLGGKIAEMIESGEVKGKYREFTLLHTDKISAKRILIMGMGKRKDYSLDRIRSITANSSRYARRISSTEMAIHDFSAFGLPAQDCAEAIVEGILLGMYRFDRHKTKKKDETGKKLLQKIKIIAASEDNVEALQRGGDKGIVIAECANYCRDLVNEPANFMTPARFAELAQEIAAELQIKIQVLEQEELEKEGMGSFLAVAKGSDLPPKMVVMEYQGYPGGKTIAIVGKGVTFDSGGYDIKPADGMLRMYGDMGGAAATLTAMKAIAQQKLPVNVVAVTPLTENLVNGKAFKPSDILTSMSGKTIEVLNTDAEGRLILCDAMTYVQKYYNPDVLVDIATLTGAAIIALGRTVSATLTNSDDLYTRMFAAGEYSGERVWRLPLYDEFRSQLVSDVADIENVGGRSAGTITAAIFLKEFVDEDRPWIHLDIAGTSMMEEEIARYVKNPYLPKEGGTGTGTRLLFHFVESFTKEN